MALLKINPARIAGIALLMVAPALPQTADTVLLNGKILTVDEQFSTRQAVAIRDGKIAALGTAAEMRKLAGRNTRIIDLQGRTVIPGLIDSHIHAIRAALSFSTEVNWIGTTSLVEALDRIREAARTVKPGAWLIVAGGWNAEQFKEKRRPTQAELIAAAPDNPVYVQLGYSWVVMTPKALEALHISSDVDGVITGGNNAIVALFDRLPKPNFAEQVEGTKKFFHELNRLGITGVVDPGGNNLAPEEYQALFKVWRQGELTLRVAYTFCGQTPGSEFAELKDMTQMLPMGFGDDMLRFNGIGERITWAMNNNNKPTEAEKEKYYEIVRWAAERGMSLTMHWNNNESVDQLLTIFERVNTEVPIGGLRWSIAHLNNASEQSLRRMKALGIGWTVQDGRRGQRVGIAKELGVPVGAGTDAHRVASYNPFTVLQSFLEGNNSRADALRFYTLGSAWFSFDEGKRGSLAVGKFADLAVLSKDYMTVPVAEVASIESVLTMVGGRIVYSKP